MTLSVWRYAHLLLAVCSFVFLLFASVTGIILAYDAVEERSSPYQTERFDELSLAPALEKLREIYPEITEISVDHNEFVTLRGVDVHGEEVNAYVDARTGAMLGKPSKKSDFIQWTTAFHRSLFLKEAGRLFIGVVAFLLMLITVSGAILIVQRQHGFKRFFSRVVNENFLQYAHVVTGRLSLIPIFIIALSGTYLSLDRFHLFPERISPDVPTEAVVKNVPKRRLAEFPAFQQLSFKDVEKIDFPFAEDPEEFFMLKLKDREIIVDQFTGEVVASSEYPMTVMYERWSMDLHTGRTSIIWAVILIVACVNILFFIYSGFAMTIRRRAATIKNIFKPSDSEVILLVGSENGSTLRFADAVHKQLLANRQASYLTEMNNFGHFPAAKHLVVFTSTHGIGHAPSNAGNFLALLGKHPQQHMLNVSVVGFGSRAYDKFCGYAQEVNGVLAEQSWANQLLPVHTIDDKSPEQFAHWVKEWSHRAKYALDERPETYVQQVGRLHAFTVVKKTAVSDDDPTFTIVFKTRFTTSFTSGDLVTIFPAGDTRERQYSICKKNGHMMLVVKLHPHGLGSGYLYTLQPGSIVRGRITHNVAFHFPKKAEAVMMICNGTGIAPFLGMIAHAKTNSSISLYGGFRTKSHVRHYVDALREHVTNGRLNKFSFAFSREEHPQYVMDLVREDAAFVVSHLSRGGVVMICGSLAMQRDVEDAIDDVLRTQTDRNLDYYRSLNQVKADCY